MLSILPHNGQRAEVESIFNLKAFADFFVGKFRGWVVSFRQWCWGEWPEVSAEPRLCLLCMMSWCSELEQRESSVDHRPVFVRTSESK
eukprot:1144073-Pelagomonas_calceolata.AAC.2